MIYARFRMPVPPDVWIHAVSTAHPEATFRLLAGIPRGERVLELGEVRATPPDGAAEAVATHPEVDAYESLHADDERALARYETTEQGLYGFLWDASLPPEFPLVFEDGEMEFDVTATREAFDAFGAALDTNGTPYELLSVVSADSVEDLLTDRQREVLTAALREGYFEIPRETTLAALADSLGVDTSTASDTVRRGAARVLKWHLTGRD